MVAVDTETVRNKPWSVQIAYMEDIPQPTVEMFYCTDRCGMDSVRQLLGHEDTLTILHNAKYDLRVLSQCNIFPSRYECTMQMAYLLGEPRISLKTLAYRICGIEMQTYDEVTYEATQAKAYTYLSNILDHTWPDPDPTMETRSDGSLHLKFPKNIKGKVQQLLKKYHINQSINLYEKWHGMEETGGRGQVEQAFGKLEKAYLDEVEPHKAEEYAKLDAYATFSIYPYLHTQIEGLGLQESLERDMDCIPMIIEMEDNGVLVNPNELELLRVDLDELTRSTQADINYIAGKYVNPRSSQQVIALLQDEGIFTDMEDSTDASVLDQYREHVIVNKIQDYRAYSKLQSTYVEGLMGMIQADGRIHTHFSTTRTGTGRLASSKPNLQNIPVRTELGRRIRKAFVSERSG